MFSDLADSHGLVFVQSLARLVEVLVQHVFRHDHVGTQKASEFDAHPPGEERQVWGGGVGGSADRTALLDVARLGGRPRDRLRRLRNDPNGIDNVTAFGRAIVASGTALSGIDSTGNAVNGSASNGDVPTMAFRHGTASNGIASNGFASVWGFTPATA